MYSHALAVKYFRPGFFGSVLTFGIKGGKEAAVHQWSKLYVILYNNTTDIYIT